jgi:hypothetical protein
MPSKLKLRVGKTFLLGKRLYFKNLSTEIKYHPPPQKVRVAISRKRLKLQREGLQE